MTPTESRMTKACTKCGEVKFLEDFYAEPRNKGGRRADCKSCAYAATKRYAASNKEKIRAIARAYRARHLDLVRARAKQWSRDNREERHSGMGQSQLHAVVVLSRRA